MSSRSGHSRGGKKGYQQNQKQKQQKGQHHQQQHKQQQSSSHDHQKPQHQQSSSPLPPPLTETAKTIVVNNLVAVQIIKHARDNIPALVTGQLLGFDLDTDVEITYSFPLLKGHAPSAEKEDPSAQETVTDHQIQMLRNLRQVKVDNNIVGWYQSTFLNLIDDQLIETQFSYQTSLPHSVCIVYDPLKSTQGALCFKAYRLSDAFMKFFSEGAFSTEKLQEYQLSHTHVLEEIPVSIQNSVLLEGLLAEFACSERVPSYPRLDLPHASFMEKTLEQLIDHTDDLIQDITHHQYWQRKRNVQLQIQAKRLHQRRELNADRIARGLPPLPEDADLHKPLAEPSRLDPLLLSAQIDQYCGQLNTFAGQAFGKLFLLEGLQGESSSAPASSSSYASHAQKAVAHH